MTLSVAAAAGTGTEASDFTLSGNTTLTIAEGETSSTGTVTVTARNNTIDAPDKTVDVSASVTSGPSNLRGPSGQTLTITDDDTAEWSVSVSPSTIAESDAGSSTVTVRTGGVTFTAARTITLDFAGSTATETTDYTVGRSR